MEVDFLSAEVRLTKTFSKSGSVEPYPLVKNFTSHREQVRNLEHFLKVLGTHAAAGHCLLKGLLSRDLQHESRAGATDPTAKTEWVCFDIDSSAVSTVEEFIRECLPPEVHDCSYIVQYSSSHVALGPREGRLSAHVYMLLEQAIPAPVLKEWIRQANVSNKRLLEAMTLNPAGTTLKWRLDPSVAQNDKLIYIAPPICQGFDPAVPQLFTLVRKTQERAVLRTQHINAAATDELVQARLNELRKLVGLKPRKPRMQGEVMMNPDRVTNYEMRVARGFVYFNLNGGNSWGYYHPEDNPDVIHNFKGEPPYSTKALLPEYWASLQRGDKPSEEGVDYFVFRDPRSALYYNGSYDKGKQVLELFTARSKEQLQDFLAQHGYAKPDFIPDWRLVFDRKSDLVYDPENRRINMYQPSYYLRNARKGGAYAVPPTIRKVLLHALGGDETVVEHFLNWLACILQHQTMTQTAWVLHGTTGTGKGMLINHVLRPIIGPEYVKILQLAQLEEGFNPWIEKCILLVLDESSIEDTKRVGTIMAKLKNWITEPVVSVRPMHAPVYQTTNHVNLMVTSNMHDPVLIHQNDRRFNVATRQDKKLQITPREFNTVVEELQAFTDYLMTRDANLDVARTVIETADREQMKQLTQRSSTLVAHKLLEGDADFFMENAPGANAMTTPKSFNGAMIDVPAVYMGLMRRIAADGVAKVTRPELFALFEHCVGGIPTTAHKFTAFLRHQDVRTKRIRVGEDFDYGLDVRFRVTREFEEWVRSRTKEGLKLVTESR